MKKVALLDSPISHGGKVSKASDVVTWKGKGVAREEDEVDCAKHGKTKIKKGEGSAIYTVDGKPAAMVGSKTECGATILSSTAELYVKS